MYLKKIGIINYKSCQKILINLAKDSPSTFIGINDSGKSAILKSVGLLLEPKSVFGLSNETKGTSDISNTPIEQAEHDKIFSTLGTPIFPYSPTSTLIMGEFIIEDELSEDFDNKASDQLKWAIESRVGESIFVLRQFDAANPAGKYFICLGEVDPPRSLWAKKATEIQAVRKEVALSDEEIKNDNERGRFSSLELLRAIYNKIGYSPAWVEMAVKDIDLFPDYLYIDWNTSLADISKLANGVLKTQISGPKTNLIKEAATLSQSATDLVNSEFEALIRDLTQDLKTITGIKAQVTFTVSEAITNLAINKTTSDGDVSLESQGEGIKRQIYFAFLKWASKDKHAAKYKNIIWCFDEPESHLYPTAQRELYKIISELSSKNFQILLGTHSTIFVDRMKLNDLNKVVLEDKYSEVLKCSGVDDVHDALGVRNSDILFFDKFILTEGETEDILIPHFYKLCIGRSMEEDCIKLISLGGYGEYQRNKTMFEKLLTDYKKIESVVHYIFDNDTGETGANVSLIGKCDLEDTLPNNLWLRLISDKCGLTWDEAKLDSIRTKLDPNNKAKKMHALVSAEVANDAKRTNFLPNKKNCAEVFKTYITGKTDVPESIRTVLETKVPMA